jgi:DNA-binding GntR family transcriptional regulator
MSTGMLPEPTTREEAPAPERPVGRLPTPVRPRRSSLVQEAHTALKARILNNELPPGHVALEQELADGLGMSRTPVHEAVIRLAEEGLVEVVPRRGIRVLPISPEDMREIYELLYSLEATAVELLSARRLPGDDPILTELDTATNAMAEALDADDLEEWARADERFHVALLSGCGNQRLARMAFTVWDQAHRARMVTLRLRPKPADSTADHRNVVEAIRRHDPEAARELHAAHRKRGMATLLGILERYRLTRL